MRISRFMTEVQQEIVKWQGVTRVVSRIEGKHLETFIYNDTPMCNLLVVPLILVDMYNHVLEDRNLSYLRMVYGLRK